MNIRYPLLLSILLTILVFTGCQKSDPVGLLPESERAPQFDKVAAHLQLGGVFYGYMDITGQALQMAQMLQDGIHNYLQENPLPMPVPLDIKKALDITGILDLSAIGMSSSQLKNGLFHNRSIFYFPEGPKGYFRVLGDDPGKFHSWELAPDTADVVFEMNYRPDLFRDTTLELIAAMGGILGRGFIGYQLQQPIPMYDKFTYNDLIEAMGKQIIFVADFDKETIEVTPEFEIRRPNLLIAVENLAGILETLYEEREYFPPQMEWTEEEYGFSILYDIGAPEPFHYLRPIIRANRETGQVWVASSPDFLDRCLSSGTRLVGTSAFNKAMENLPSEGISFSFLSADVQEIFVTAIQDILSMEPDTEFAANWVSTLFPDPLPMAAVSTISEEGIYSASNWSTSHRSTVASLSFQPSLYAIGISAAMAIPAFEKVRSNSQEKTVLNNLRQIASAGQQYLLEEGVKSVAYTDLTPTYFAPISPVAGEDYSNLVVTFSGTLSVRLANGQIVKYTY